mgnify:CR=1 FL=1
MAALALHLPRQSSSGVSWIVYPPLYRSRPELLENSASWLAVFALASVRSVIPLAGVSLTHSSQRPQVMVWLKVQSRSALPNRLGWGFAEQEKAHSRWRSPESHQRVVNYAPQQRAIDPVLVHSWVSVQRLLVLRLPRSQRDQSPVLFDIRHSDFRFRVPYPVVMFLGMFPEL